MNRLACGECTNDEFIVSCTLDDKRRHAAEADLLTRLLKFANTKVAQSPTETREPVIPPDFVWTKAEYLTKKTTKPLNWSRAL